MGMSMIARASISINAPDGRVWDALVNPDAIRQYMFGASAISDWREGSSIVWKGEWQGKSYEGGAMNGLDGDMAAIRKLAADWSAGWNSSDTEALLSLYGDDPVLMPQGRPAVYGKDAICSLYRSIFQEFTVKGEGKLVEAAASGDLGYFWSSYTLTAKPISGGEEITEQGKSIFIVRRQRDAWKIARLIDNSDREQAAGR